MIACFVKDDKELDVLILTMQEIIYRSYLDHLFGSMRTEMPLFDQSLQETREGYRGMSYDIIKDFLGHEPSLTTARRTARSTNFSGFSCHWVSRLHLLFDWDDGFQRRWENRPFRARAKRFYHLLENHLGGEVADRFRRTLGQHATRCIWLIPKYDRYKLFLPIKISPNPSKARRKQLGGETASRRLMWLGGTHSRARQGRSRNSSKSSCHTWPMSGWRFLDPNTLEESPPWSGPPCSLSLAYLLKTGDELRADPSEENEASGENSSASYVGSFVFPSDESSEG